jgi:hypothetical protein
LIERDFSGNAEAHHFAPAFPEILRTGNAEKRIAQNAQGGGCATTHECDRAQHTSAVIRMELGASSLGAPLVFVRTRMKAEREAKQARYRPPMGVRRYRPQRPAKVKKEAAGPHESHVRNRTRKTQETCLKVKVKVKGKGKGKGKGNKKEKEKSESSLFSVLYLGSRGE